jgi:hypothetical protein
MLASPSEGIPGQRRKVLALRSGRGGTSVITSKSAIYDHFKIGQRNLLRTRVVLPYWPLIWQALLCCMPAVAGRGIALAGFQRSALKSLLGGAAASMRAGRGGNPPAPAFPGGETGRGDQIPCCRRRIRSAPGPSAGSMVVAADLVRQLFGPHLSTCP